MTLKENDIAIRRSRLAVKRAGLSTTQQAELERLFTQLSVEDSSATVIPPRPPGPAPLSFAQQRLWFLDQLDPGQAAYNIPALFRLTGELQIAAFTQALNEIVRRHDVLRTSFAAIEGTPVQVIAETGMLELPLVDLQELREGGPGQIQSLGLEHSQKPFDLAAGQLFRVTLLQVGDGDYVLMVTLHHIISDAWSFQLLTQEVETIYRQYCQGEPTGLPELNVQYVDYAHWQRQSLEQEKLESELSYWREQLRNSPPILDLPLDRPRPAKMTFRGKTLSAFVPAELTEKLRSVSEAEGLTLFMTLLTGFQLLLARYTGQDDIVVGTPVAGREWVETENLIGFFANTLVLRARFSENPSISEALWSVRNLVLDAQSHQLVPFERLVEELRPDRTLSYAPLFQVMFALQNIPRKKITAQGGLTLNEIDFDPGMEKFDLTLSVSEEKYRLACSLSYSVDLFNDSTIDRLMKHWQRVLQEIVTDVHRSVWDFPLLDQAEQRQIISEWNWPQARPAEYKSLVERFEMQAAARPDAIAISFQDEQISYGELNGRANQLARLLQRMGVMPEVFVGICMERSVEMIVSILAVAKAGGAYVPLDPAYPRERLEFILLQIEAPVLLTQKSLQNTIAGLQARSLCVEAEQEAIAREGRDNLGLGLLPGNAAYVIYTSGSTGRPKGVTVTQENLTRLFTATEPWYRFDATDSWTLFHSYAFDFSVWELWGALLYGGRCVLVPYWMSRSPEDFYRLLIEEQITVLNQTPSAFAQLMGTEAFANETEKLALRFVIFGGEALSIESLAPWFKKYGDTHPLLVNMYGITETTVHVTYRPLRWADVQESRGSMVGMPLPDLQLYLADRRRHVVPIGGTGEILVGGAGLARGYFKAPELTAERFIPDPLSENPGARLYCSGDLARYREGRDIKYVGRSDYQVKVRGHRIELGEIETTLRMHPDVRGAIVIAKSAGQGETRLVAYIATKTEPAPSVHQIQVWLKDRIPAYMLPSSILVLKEIPLNANGKPDRSRLPEPAETDWEPAEGPLPPRTSIEEIISGIWADLLGLKKIRRTDNFFWIGGHSLLAIQLVTRIRKAFLVDIPVRMVFEAPTLVELAGAVHNAMSRRHNGGELSVLSRRVSAETAPLSFAQQRLWFVDQLLPGSSHYNIPAAVQINTDLNVAAVEQSLTEICRRHEILRTTFTAQGGQPAQAVHSPAPIRIPLVDLSGLPDQEKDVLARRLAHEEALRPFDLAEGPLLRTCLVVLEKSRFIQMLTMHHIISDGWSMGVLMREVEVLYQAALNGTPSPLEELAIQYADYAAWQQERLQEDVSAAELEYWRSQLAGAPALLDLPTDYTRPEERTLSGARCPIVFSQATSHALHSLARQKDATVFMVLMAVFQAILARYSEQDDLLVGTPIAGRSRIELEPLVGFFVNMVVLRARIHPGMSFSDLLSQARESALGAYTHQDYPFDKLVEELHPVRNIGRNPFFQAILAFQNVFTPGMEMAGVTLPSGSPGSADTKFDLEAYFWEEQDRIGGSLVYSPELFEEATVARLADRFQLLLEQAVAEPDIQLSAAVLMRDAELRQVTAEWNNTTVPYPADRCVHEIFEVQARLSPDAVALESEDEQVTYSELNSRANVLARYLCGHGAGPETFVGVLLERSNEMIVSLLGIAKAGASYVPLNVADPPKRIEFILQESRISILLTIKRIAEKLPDLQLNVVLLDSDQARQEILHSGNTEDLNLHTGPGQLLYMIHTSGSTGRPKGVCVTHRNVVKLVKGANYADLSAKQVFLQFAPISFDASTLEIWAALLNGARLVIHPPGLPGLNDLAEFIVGSQVTTMWLTAGLFHQMVDGNVRGLRGVKQLLAGGEALSIPHVKKVLKELPGCRLIDGYGPTETTTFACCCTLTSDVLRTSVPIGRPISNTHVYVLDHALRPVPINERGQLFIGGDGVARGYFNHSALTAEKFVPDPFAAQAGQRMYRTGDIVRYRNDGNVEFFGRRDTQVKLRGFRIELGEIETILSEHPGVKQTAVLVMEDISGNKRMVAYLVADPEKPPTSEMLREYLKQRLPDYMVPSVFMVLEALPLTLNGKLDKAALPAPDRSLIRSAREFAAPRDALQEQLVSIWEELLAIRPIGVHDDFFELGGHSLLAVQLITRVEEKLGKRLPMVAFFKEPTIASMSQALSQDFAPQSSSLLVPIQPNGTNPPLFCMHAAGGHVFCYADLARQLGQDQPFYGLQARASKAILPYSKLEEMAAEYVAAIRSFQPEGPYFIGGWSMGGVIAFEVARQLQMQGQRIALLVLIDADAPAGKPVEYTWAVLLGSFARNLGLSVENLGAKWDEIVALTPMKQLSHVWSEAKKAELISPTTNLADFRKLFDSFKANAQLMTRYEGGAYEGRITLFRASKPLQYIGKKTPENYYSETEPARGWGQWANGGVEINTVEGDHHSIIREPQVKILAEQLQARIRDAAKELGGS